MNIGVIPGPMALFNECENLYSPVVPSSYSQEGKIW